MNKFRPTIYKKNIFEIDYQKLKKEGITCLVFDLDNTLALLEDKECPEDTKDLIKKLQEDFLLLIFHGTTYIRTK